jgi:hypothetical protein
MNNVPLAQQLIDKDQDFFVRKIPNLVRHVDGFPVFSAHASWNGPVFPWLSPTSPPATRRWVQRKFSRIAAD